MLPQKKIKSILRTECIVDESQIWGPHVSISESDEHLATMNFQ